MQSEIASFRAGSESPRELYQARLDASRRDRARLDRDEAIVANLRLFTFALAVAIGGLAAGGSIGWGWIGVPACGFAGLVAAHVRVRRSIRRAGRASAFYQRGIERIEGRWAGRGEDGARFGDEAHPFAADLDTFGHGSLFQRLNTARTPSGEAALADLLKHPEATPDQIRRRQESVADLASRLDFREQLDLLGEAARSALDAEGLLAWGRASSTLTARWLGPAAILLAALGAATLVGWLFVGTGASPFFASVVLDLLFWFPIRGRVGSVLEPLNRRAAELDLLAGLLGRIEGEQFAATALRELVDQLKEGGSPPSSRIATLARLARRLDGTNNPLIQPFAALLLTRTRLAIAVEAWRRVSGPAIGRWIAAVGRVEAIASLGAYAFENPDDPYPDLADDGPVFDAREVAHPLIPRDRAVANTLRLDANLRVLVVSGSNMSGKSTLLRTVGVNAVLAMAGAPVRASAIRLSPLRIGATLRVQDSLQANVSRFFAELTRLRQVVDLAGTTPPLLFLLDEIFHGTNSEDRRVGASGVVRGLVARGAIGLVTTHDLALAAVAEGLGPVAANVHFSDRFEEGGLVFDYTMQPGIVRHSNALALMRAVGLDVGEAFETETAPPVGEAVSKTLGGPVPDQDVKTFAR